jgi:Flp pilus assembly protein TadG
MIRRLRGERGQTLVEFALVLPVLLLLLLGIIQVGLFIFTQVDVRQATRAGARTLITLRNDSNAAQEVDNAITSSVNPEVDTGKLLAGISFSPVPPSGGWAPGTTVTLTVTYPQSLNVMGIGISNSPIVSTAVVTVE